MHWSLTRTNELRKAIDEKTKGKTIKIKTLDPEENESSPFLHEIQATLDGQLELMHSNNATNGFQSTTI